MPLEVSKDMQSTANGKAKMSLQNFIACFCIKTARNGDKY